MTSRPSHSAHGQRATRPASHCTAHTVTVAVSVITTARNAHVTLCRLRASPQQVMRHASGARGRSHVNMGGYIQCAGIDDHAVHLVTCTVTQPIIRFRQVDAALQCLSAGWHCLWHSHPYTHTHVGCSDSSIWGACPQYPRRARRQDPLMAFVVPASTIPSKG